MKTMREPEVLTWTCPKCGKKIWSLYPAQLAYQKEVHLLTHKRLTWSRRTRTWG